MRGKHAFRPSLEALEDRWAPATLRLIGGNLYISNPTGALVVETNASPGRIDVTDNGQLISLGGIGGLISITGTNKNDAVTFRANARPFAGSVLFNTGNANDTVALQATAPGGIGGNVTVLPGLGADTTAISAAARVGGSLRVVDTSGINSFINVAGLTTGGDLSVSGVTAFVSTAALTVGGSLAVSSTPGASNLGLTFAGTTTIGQDLRITSSAPSTGINLPGTMTVGGDLTLRLGQASNLAIGATVTVNGNLHYFGGEGTDGVAIATGFVVAGNARVDLGGGSNSFSSAPGALFAGDLSLSGGSGGNVINSLGNIGGNLAVTEGNGSNGTIVGGTVGGRVRYRGGNGSEALTLAPAVPATVVADLVFGSGTATLLLTSNVSLTGRVRGNGGVYTFVQGGATLLPPLVFENFP